MKDKVKKFLLVDDDLDDTGLFSEALNEVDPAIICYVEHNGKAALDKLDSKEFERPDIIFVDINMPGMNGWQCLAELKKDDRYKNIPVIMYSTSSYSGDADKAIEMGALCFFTKPSDYNLLKDILKAFAENLDGSIVNAISRFNNITTKKIFNCS
jgi:CheY-like chemotaxis protein